MTTTTELPTPATVDRARAGKSWLSRWASDLTLGLRLAVGSGRTSWGRLVLGTVGIGMAVAVLLIAASTGTVAARHQAKSLLLTANSTPIAGVDRLDLASGGTTFHGVDIDGTYLHATGPHAPVPSGLSRLPGPGEIVLSPALATLLASPDGAVLRPRFPQRVIGTIGDSGLQGPAEIQFYAGASAIPARMVAASAYSFNQSTGSSPLDPALLVLMVVGAVVLLIPILIFITVSSRIAGAQRDRRLAALRLVGADSRQVRRIAAGESLVAAGCGLVFGTALFLLARQFAPDVDLIGSGVFTEELTPPWPLVVLIVLAVPLLAVVSGLAALRRTIIEPLGVVREAGSVRRRLWWRLALIVLGVVALVGDAGRKPGAGVFLFLLVFGSSALLVGVPVLLPWLLERVAGLLRGGAPSWQLAMGRLRLDSGTPARVVGGVAVVLASAIALQTLLFTIGGRYQSPASSSAGADTAGLSIYGPPEVSGQVPDALRGIKGVRATYGFQTIGAKTGQDKNVDLAIAPCAVIMHLTTAHGCADGDVFAFGPDTRTRPGTQLDLINDTDYQTANPRPVGRWTVPTNVPTVTESDASMSFNYTVLATPAALAGVTLPPQRQAVTVVYIDPAQPDSAEYVRNAMAPLALQVDVDSFGSVEQADVKGAFAQLRDALLVGALFTLLMAGVSLLVLALEQIRERRQPLALLAAAGVPRGMLARSLLWQSAIPVLIGVLMAVVTGLGFGALVLDVTTSVPFAVDWVSVGLFTAAAVLLTLLVTAATLPALRGATRLTALRSE